MNNSSSSPCVVYTRHEVAEGLVSNESLTTAPWWQLNIHQLTAQGVVSSYYVHQYRPPLAHFTIITLWFSIYYINGCLQKVCITFSPLPSMTHHADSISDRLLLGETSIHLIGRRVESQLYVFDGCKLGMTLVLGVTEVFYLRHCELSRDRDIQRHIRTDTHDCGRSRSWMRCLSEQRSRRGDGGVEWRWVGGDSPDTYESRAGGDFIPECAAYLSGSKWQTTLVEL